MPVNNEYLYNSRLGDGAIAGDSGEYDTNSLADVVAHPVDLVVASAADAFSSIYNLGAAANIYDPIKTSDVLETFSNVGLPDAQKYFKAHPIASQLGSLLIGGGIAAKVGTGVFNLASKAASKSLSVSMKSGKVMFNDSVTQFGKQARLEQAVADKMATDTVYGEGFKQSLKKLNALGGGAIFADAAIQETVFAGLMSQHTMLEDYDWKDWMIGAGVYGGISLGLKALSSKFDRTKALTSSSVQEQNKVLQEQMTYISPEIKGTMAEASVVQRDVADLLAMESDDALDQGTKMLAGRLRLIGQARQQELVTNILNVKGMSPDMVQNTRGAMLDMVNDPLQIAGVQKISALGANKGIVDRLQRVNKGVLSKDEEYLAAGLPVDSIRAGLLEGKDVKTLAKELGIKSGEVKSVETLLTHQVYDLENKRFMDLHEATRLVGGTHREIDGKYLIYDKTASSGAVQTSLKEAAKAGQKARGIVLALSKDGKGLVAEENILTRTTAWEYFNKHSTGIVNGKKLDNETFAALKNQYGLMHIQQGRVELRALEGAGYSVAELERRLNLTGITDFGAEASTIGIRNVGKSWKGAEHRNLLVLQGNLSHTNKMQAAIAADKNVLSNQANDTLRQMVAASGSGIAQEILDTANSGISTKMLETLDATNPALFSSRALGSADFALRHQPIQEMANLSGTRRKSLRDRVVQNVDKDLAKSLHLIQLDKTNLILWNKSELAVRNARAGKDEIVTLIGRGDNLDDFSKGGQLVIQNIKTQAITQELDKFSATIAEFWAKYQKTHASELLKFKNLNRTVNGMKEIRGKGLILSAKNLTVGERAYLVSRTPGLAEKERTIMLNAPTKGVLQELIARAQTTHPDFEVLTPGANAKRYNLVNDHVQLGYMKFAEFGKSQTGVRYTDVAQDTSQMEAFLKDTLGEYGRQTNELWKNMHGEVVSKLKNMIDITEGYGDGKNVWNTIYKTAFGGSELADHKILADANDLFVEGVQHVADIAKDSLAGLLKDKAARVGGNFLRKVQGKKTLGNRVTYEEILADWESKGFKKEELPWSNAADALLETKAYREAGKFAEEAVAFNNFTTATLALRFLEFAHPLVNSLSIPITTMPEIGAAMKAAGHKDFSAMKLMMEGIVRSADIKGVHSAKYDRWLEQGITTPQVAEMTKMRQSLAVNPGLVSKLENNKVFEIATKVSTLSESMARRISAGTADAVFDILHRTDKATLGNDVLRDAFVNTFVKRAQGNYATAQRPVMFQGTLGSMLGLFQTYMWTLGQNTYRFLEAGDKARVLQMGALQTGIFGLESMPGYAAMNDYIGSHFGNMEHKNANSMMFDQVNPVDGYSKKLVESIVYGFPGAALDTALYTRGTLAPRVPIGFTAKGGFEANVAAVAPLMTAIGLYTDTMDRFGEGAGLGDSFTAALQLQQLSRPFSRYADFVAGNSIERTGSVVDPMSSFKWDLATLARATGARPLQDQIMRNLTWTNSYYNSQAGLAKRKVLKAVRLLQQGEGDVGTEEAMVKLFDRYVKEGGSVMGFRSAVNDAAVNNSTGKVVDIKPDSALYNIQSLYGYSDL